VGATGCFAPGLENPIKIIIVDKRRLT
jgi:hypothetical protein